MSEFAVQNQQKVSTFSGVSKSDLQQPQKYTIKPNGVDKTPDKDTVEVSSKNSTAKKVGIGAAIVAAAIGLYCLFRGRKPSKQIIEQVEQAIAHEPPKMQMTEEAKKAYDNVASKLNKKSEITAESIDRNLAPKQKDGAWDSKDMKEYYTQFEKESAEKAAKEAEANAAKEAEQARKAEVVSEAEAKAEPKVEAEVVNEDPKETYRAARHEAEVKAENAIKAKKARAAESVIMREKYTEDCKQLINDLNAEFSPVAKELAGGFECIEEYGGISAFAEANNLKLSKLKDGRKFYMLSDPETSSNYRMILSGDGNCREIQKIDKNGKILYSAKNYHYNTSPDGSSQAVVNIIDGRDNTCTCTMDKYGSYKMVEYLPNCCSQTAKAGELTGKISMKNENTYFIDFIASDNMTDRFCIDL